MVGGDSSTSSTKSYRVSPEFCSSGGQEHDSNNNNNNMEFLSLSEANEAISEWYSSLDEETEEVAQDSWKSKVQFSSMGQALLQKAMESNKMLMTLQIGGMDGWSNDPLYGMFVEKRPKTVESLENWFPVVIEPVPYNFQELTKTYNSISKDHGLKCKLLERRAITSNDQSETCPFYRTDISETADQSCKDMPKWLKYQVGTLNETNAKGIFRSSFKKCVVKDNLPCGSVNKLWKSHGLPIGGAPMIQIDVEGYEEYVIPNILDPLPDASLPPVIHFEQKTLIRADKLDKTKRFPKLLDVLRKRGYKLYDRGEDMLALLLISKDDSDSSSLTKPKPE